MAPTPPPEPAWPVPQFAIRIEDLAHPGVAVFFKAVGPNPLPVLRDAALASFKWLYTPASVPRRVKRIELVLRAMDGVAHAFGEDKHKQIHFSLDYIEKQTPERVKKEIVGVLTHEIVHCYQYNALGTCPGGLIEGIADYVRLREELAPPHWKRTGGDKWDAGYDRTAYFLAWLEERFHRGIVMELNARMLGVEYNAGIFKSATGRSVGKLWKMYCAHLEGRAATVSDSE